MKKCIKNVCGMIAWGMCLCTLLFCCNPRKVLYKEYFLHTYNPIVLTHFEIVNSIPDSFKIKGYVMSLSEASDNYTPARVLQIMDMHQYHSQIDAYNWATGYTYDASFRESFRSFTFTANPETSFEQAQNEIGYRQKLYVSTDSLVFVQKIKTEILQKILVYVQLKNRVLYETSDEDYTGVLIMGYTPEGFLYISPTQAGSDNQLMSWNDLSNAIKQFADAKNYPYLYQWISIEKAVPNPNANFVGMSNAIRLKGSSVFGLVYTGNKAIMKLAEEIEQFEQLNIEDMVWLRKKIYEGFLTRSANQKFLRKTFPRDENMLQACAQLQLAAEIYKALSLEMNHTPKNRLVISNCLKKAAHYEWLAAEWMQRAASKSIAY